nr:uncharacterized protein LOC110359245 isoform X2 [Columba livia]
MVAQLLLCLSHQRLVTTWQSAESVSASDGLAGSPQLMSGLLILMKLQGSKCTWGKQSMSIRSQGRGRLEEAYFFKSGVKKKSGEAGTFTKRSTPLVNNRHPCQNKQQKEKCARITNLTFTHQALLLGRDLFPGCLHLSRTAQEAGKTQKHLSRVLSSLLDELSTWVSCALPRQEELPTAYPQ